MGIFDKVSGKDEPDRIEKLIRALKVNDDNVRKLAAVALGNTGDVRAIQPLIQVLKDESLTIQIAAASSLGKIGEPAVEPLLRALKDPDAEWGAITALGHIGDERPIEHLVKASRDAGPMIRGAAVIALGKIRSERVVEPLIQVLENETGRIIRIFAIEALENIGDSRAITPLTKASRDTNDSVRKAAEGALKKIQPK